MKSVVGIVSKFFYAYIAFDADSLKELLTRLEEATLTQIKPKADH